MVSLISKDDGGEIVTIEGNPNWAEVGTAVGTILLALAALIALRQISQARRARYAEAATEAARRWNDRAHRETRSVVARYIKSGGPEELKNHMMKLRDESALEYFEFLTVPDYFEDLHILIKCRAISFRIVDDSLGTTVTSYWSKCKPFVLALRQETKDNRTYENFEKLAVKISNRHWYTVIWG